MTLNVITVWEMVLEIRRTTLYNSHVHQLCDYALSLEHDEKLRKQIIADDEKQIESLLAQLAELRTQFHQQCDAMQVNADCDETTIESLRVEVSRLTAENEALRAEATRERDGWKAIAESNAENLQQFASCLEAERAEVTRLKGEWDKAIDLYGTTYAKLAAVYREISGLTDELTAATRDRERLDWLGKTLTCVVTLRDSDGQYRDHYLHGTDMTIREAIDARLSGTPENTK